jgi:hypothetical protein
MYLVFAKVAVIILSTQMHPTNVGRGRGQYHYKHIIILLLALVECIWVLKFITVALANTEYITYDTHNTQKVYDTCMLNTINIFHQD